MRPHDLIARFKAVLTHPVVAAAVQVACAVVLLKGMYDLWDMLWFESEGPMNGDAFIYLAMGRGILNGLAPYADLLESKPPGMFLLFALSLLTTGTERLVALVEMAFLTLIPALFGVWAWRRWGGTTSASARIVLLFSVILGILLSLRLQQVAGALQTELFGAFFGLGYVLTVLWSDRDMNWKRMGIAGFCMMCAIGLKEPFFLALLAAALLLCQTPRAFLRSFVVPLGMAVVAGSLVLLLLGFWNEYWGIYIPTMFQNRLSGPGDFSLLLRMLWVLRLYGGFTIYSPMPLLGYALACCLGLLVARQAGQKPLGQVLAAIAVGVFVYELGNIVMLMRLEDAMKVEGITDHRIVPLYAPFVQKSQTLGAVFLVLLGAIAWLMPRGLFTLVRVFAALLLLSLVFGISGYTGNDAGNAFVGLFAIALFALRELGNKTNEAKWAWPVIGAVVLMGMFNFKPSPLADRRAQFMGTRPQYQAFSQSLDSMLTACGSPPYYYMGTQPAMAYATHSPIGPVFTPHFSGFLGQDHPLYLETKKRITETAQVLIEIPVPAGKVDPLWAQIRGPFGPDVPPCAQSTVFPAGYTVTYRKAGSGGTLWKS